MHAPSSRPGHHLWFSWTTVYFLFVFLLTGTTKAPFEPSPKSPASQNSATQPPPQRQTHVASPQVFLSGTAAQAEKKQVNKRQEQKGKVWWLQLPAWGSPQPGASGRASPWPRPPFSSPLPLRDPNLQTRFKVWERFCLLSGL